MNYSCQFAAEYRPEPQQVVDLIERTERGVSGNSFHLERVSSCIICSHWINSGLVHQIWTCMEMLQVMSSHCESNSFKIQMADRHTPYIHPLTGLFYKVNLPCWLHLVLLVHQEKTLSQLTYSPVQLLILHPDLSHLTLK